MVGQPVPAGRRSVLVAHPGTQHSARVAEALASTGHLDRYLTSLVWRRDGVLEIPNARTKQVHRLASTWLEDAERNAADLDILAAARSLATPTLIVHGTADGSVGFEEGEAICAAIPEGTGRLVPIMGAEHTFGAVHPYRGSTPELDEAFDHTLGFLEDCLR